MKKEQKMEPQHNSDSAADNSHFQPTCPKPIVGGSFSGRPVATLYKRYVDKALSAENKNEFREHACACDAIFETVRLLGNRDDVRAIREVINNTDFLFTEYGKPDEGCYLLRSLS